MTQYLDKLNELGALGAWMLDESSGTVATDLIGSNDGSYNSTYTLNQASLARNGEYKSVDLAGSTGGGYVAIPHDANYETSEVSFAIHAYIDTKITNADLMSLRDAAVNNGGFIFAEIQSGSGDARCFFRILTNWRWVDIPAASIPTGEAAFWVYTYDGDYARVYKNGSLVVTSANYSGVINWGSGTNYLRLGQNPTTGSARHDGKIQGAAVFDYALSDAEVLDLYKSTATFTSGLSGSLGSLNGGISKQSNKITSGVIGSINGGISKQINKSLNGILGLVSGDILKETSKVLSGTLGNLNGSMARLTSKVVSGTLGILSGALLFVRPVSIGGTLGAINGGLVKQTNKSINGTLGNIYGDITKFTSKILSGTLGSLSGIGAGFKTFLQSVGGTIGSLSGSLAKQTGKNLSGEISPTGSLKSIKRFVTQKVRAGYASAFNVARGGYGIIRRIR